MKRALLCLIFACFPLILSAQEHQYPSYHELQREQSATAERLREAQRFLSEASTSFDRTLYNYSFELLSQASSRLARADATLENQIDNIANMRATIFRSRPADREELNDRRTELRQQYFELNRRAQSLSRDILPYVGVDMDHVRGLLSTLHNLAENHPDQSVREWARRLIERFERLLDQGDPDAIQNLLDEADDELERRTGDRTRPQDDRPGTDRDGDPRDDERDTRPGDEPRPERSIPGSLDQETVDWMLQTLEDICENHEDPEVRQIACDLLDQAREALANEDYAKVSEIIQKVRREVAPNAGDFEIRDMPVNINGEIRYFPPNFGRAGVGRRYIGGEGARLVQETEERLRLANQGRENERWEVEAGDSRSWRFNVSITNQRSIEDGRAIDFRLSEGNREGEFTLDGWRVTGPENRRVAEGSGDSGSVELKETGRYTIEFRGETEWGSPFGVKTLVEIAL
ncbi:MAG: LYR motif-containing protein [Opitutales bacterium]|nr:LYR motif-containing protein [Opitutales bacterium]